jgi:hypothetical protein
LALLALAIPLASAAQSPAAAPSAVPSAVPTVEPATGSSQEAWTLAICTAYARIGEAQTSLAGVGQAALAGDTNAIAVGAISAGLLGDQALQALESLDGTWTPGAAVSGYLTATGFALVDLGVALAEAAPTDADAFRNALGSAIASYDGWARVAEEMAILQQATGFDCTAVPVPSPEPFTEPSFGPATPEPTYLGDAELVARFPAEIGGQTVAPESRSAAELLASMDPADTEGQARLQDLSDFLDANGHTIDDISLAFAYVPTEDGYGASITAFRVRDGDAAALLDGLIPLITIDYTDLQRDTVTVDGRDLARVSEGPYDPAGIYEVLVPVGDTVWAVSASDAVLEEIVAALH